MLEPELPDRECALFFDFDGTLVDLAPNPGAVQVHQEVPRLLADGMALLRGKMVIEMKPRRAGKGLAVRSFMDEGPFRLRRPWFFGDDVTDEAAFEAVQTLGGVSVKIGEGETQASHRLPDPAALRNWMARLARQLAAAHSRAESP